MYKHMYHLFTLPRQCKQHSVYMDLLERALLHNRQVLCLVKDWHGLFILPLADVVLGTGTHQPTMTLHAVDKQLLTPINIHR